MKSRVTAGLMVVVLTACFGADNAPRSFASIHEVCPEGVAFFLSAVRVPGMYREVALLPVQNVADRETAKRAADEYRREAGRLGANAVVLTGKLNLDAKLKLIGDAIGDSVKRHQMAVAIYIPSDSERVNAVCQPSAVLSPIEAAAARRAVGSDNVLLASRRLPLSQSGKSGGLHRPLVRVRPAIPMRQPGPAAAFDRFDQPDSTAFTRNQDVRSALAILERLDFVTDAEEVRPGLVRLSMGNVEPRARMEYHMSLLHGSYQAALPYGSDAIVELWAKGSKVGEYTKEGLVVDAKPQ